MKKAYSQFVTAREAARKAARECDKAARAHCDGLGTYAAFRTAHKVWWALHTEAKATHELYLANR